MTTVRRMTLLAIGLLLASAAAAQTVSQKCVDSVLAAYPDEARVWVVAAHSLEDHSELIWRSASGRVGVCRLEPDGRVSDVAVTGRRPVTAPEPSSAAEPPFEPYGLTCESEHGGRTECDVKPTSVVMLVEQLGENDCIENITWGQVGNAIWVDGGCRAVFEVSPRPVRIDPGSLRAEDVGPQETGEGMRHPRFRETRAQEQCQNLAAGRGILVRRMIGSRIDGDSVVVLMEVETWSQRQEVTCRYDPATDQAVIAR